MTTIGKVAYIATWDASQLVKGVMTSRQVFSAQKKIVEAMRSPLERYSLGMENLKKVVEKYPDVAKHQLQLEKQLEAQYLSQERAVRKLTVAEASRLKVLQSGSTVRAQPGVGGDGQPGRGGGLMGGLAGGLAGLGRAALPMASAAGGLYLAKRIATEAITTHAAIERQTAAMEIFTGSAARAASMMSRMRDLSTESGVGFDSLQNAASTMMSFGVATEKTLPALRSMAEITRGDTLRLQSLSLAFAQASAAGKLMGQDLLQMVNAGFNPLQEMSRKSGKSITVLRDEMSAGLITFDQVAAAFESATAAGGKFHGMMDKIADTSAGSLAKVGAEWSIFLDKFGEKLAPLTKDFSKNAATGLSELSTVFSQFDDQVARRMDAAKLAGGETNFLSGGLGGLVYGGILNLVGMQSDLVKSAELNNKLDEQLAKFQEKNKKFAQMKEGPKDLVAPAATKAGQDAIYRLNVELGLVDKIADRRKRLMADGLNSIEVQRVIAMERQLDLIEKQKRAQEKLRDSRRDEMEKMQSRGRQLMKSLQSPMEAYRAELADLLLLRRSGAIDDRTMVAGANAAAGKLPSSESKSRSELAPSVRSGSDEAYRFYAETQSRLMAQRQAKNSPEMQQVKAMNDLAALSREGNRVLAAIRDGLPAMGSDS